MRENSWRRFFEHEAPIYEQEVFTKDTLREVDFLCDELNLRSGQTILDIGCGTGRHSLELAKRGLSVTGVDLSPDMLAQARKKAEEAKVPIELIECDAQDYRADEAFDAAICLCEGALCLLGDEDDPLDRDVRILTNIRRALKPGARFLTTVLSASRMLRLYSDDDVAAGKFDPINLIESCDHEIGPPEDRSVIKGRERCFTPPEFTRMCREAGLVVEHIWGGTAGDWGRRQLKMDEYEFMVVAHRPEE